MSQIQKKVLELMFWFQILVTVAFFVPFQVHKMLYSTDGVILTSFLFVDVYAMFMLSLAIGSHRAAPSATTSQQVWIWVLGVAVYSTLVLVFLAKSDDWWNANDTVNGTFALIGIAGASALIAAKGLPLRHPDVRMSLAIAFRVIPQLMLAMNIIANQSSAGVSAMFVWCFHALIGCRVFMTLMSIKEQGRDRNRQCMLIAESLGWATWTVVTAAWVAY